MDKVTFKLNGDDVTVCRDDVRQAVRNLRHRDLRKWAVGIDGQWYPLKETFRQAIHRDDFTSQRAHAVLRRLDFRVTDDREEIENTAPKSSRESSSGTASVLSPELRLSALNAAITYSSSRPDLKPSEVLEAADAFASWLAT
jgi:hypothetical protein